MKAEEMTDQDKTNRVNVLYSVNDSAKAKVVSTNKSIAKDMSISIKQLKELYKRDEVLERMKNASNRNLKKSLKREKEFIAFHIDGFIDHEQKSDWSAEEFDTRMRREVKRLSKAFYKMYDELSYFEREDLNFPK